MNKMESKNSKKAEDILNGGNSRYLEYLQNMYLKDPKSVDQSWSSFFKTSDTSAEKASWSRSDWPVDQKQDFGIQDNSFWSSQSTEALEEKILAYSEKSDFFKSTDNLKEKVIDSLRALMIIRAFRIRGHLKAKLDPLEINSLSYHPELDPKNYGFSEEDMERDIYIDNVLGLEVASMSEIMSLLERTYCGTFALQYMHISNPEQSAWLKERIEGLGKEIQFTEEGRKAILNKLIEAEGFEKFLHVKYTGTKRFGLDGGESLIPAMEQIIKRGGNLGVKEIVIGMPHRGRLSILANVMSKPFKAIFNEFQGGSYKPEDVDGSGDVKYHLGASSDREFDGNKVHLSLTANPSHLEAVNPVVLGKVRAKQEQLNDKEREKVLPVLLHGDAAFAGQGIVAECFGLSGLKGHRTGGTIHIVVNNQIGFTTAPLYSRSSPYPTDIALMVEAPIFHVNGDDPEAVVHAAKVATEFRQKFKKDVVIDIFCYRRFGHNEGDEPMFTQPIMYKKIKTHPTALELYARKLEAEGILRDGELNKLKSNFQSFLNDEFEAGKNYKPNKADWLDGRWSGLTKRPDNYERGKTSIKKDVFKKISKVLTTVPNNFNIHKTVSRMIENKKDTLNKGRGIDWATAEALAFGSLLNEGFSVRLSGQDSKRGTFSQRHSAIIDQETEERFYPLYNITQNSIEFGVSKIGGKLDISQKTQFEVIDSMLSEYAVLGYEYGYSLAEPNCLTLWEAQFGDFVNGAQIMIDQFISSGEKKWLRMSGLVMLLPHGYEGQGPEHSSARLERFLQACAEENWIVANVSTPANYFHILRRQMHRHFRKPLVIMTPKSLLRNKLAVSSLKDFTNGSSFHRILKDDAETSSDFKLTEDSKIKKVVICSGKIYYELFMERNKRNLKDVYLLRLEQLYPFPSQSMIKELSRFENAKITWCQEEPRNQGGWFFVDPILEMILGHVGHNSGRADYAGRQSAASPATGLAKQHIEQQEKLIDQALEV